MERMFAALHQVCHAAAGPADLGLDPVLADGLAETMAAVAAEAGAIYLLTQGATSLHLHVHQGFSEAITAMPTLPLAANEVMEKALTAREVTNDDADPTPCPPRNAFLKENGLIRMVYTPLFSIGAAVGVMELGFRHERTISEEERRFLFAVGAILGGQVRIATLCREVTAEKTGHAVCQEKLRSVSEALRQNGEAFDEFTYAVSHDLNEPLHKIAGFSELLARRYKGKLDAKADTFFHYIVDGTVRMRDLLRELVLFSRITTRGGEFVAVDANEAFTQALKGLTAVIAKHDARVTSDRFPVVLADPVQFVELFRHLLANAITFHDAGAPPPEIHVSAERASETSWRFAVRDNGIGIHPQFHERIFRIFQRLHSRGEYPGTGMGLAFAKRIVERHGGRIWVDSHQGEGATFYFTMPGTQPQ